MKNATPTPIRDVNQSPKPSTWAISLAPLFITTCIIIAVYKDYFYYADASFFAVAIHANDAVDVVWRQFPLRIAALIITQGPAMAANSIGASWSLQTLIYATTFLSLPLITSLIILKITPRPEATSLTGLLLILSLCTFGFPSETSIALSAAILAVACLRRNLESPSKRFLTAGAALVAISAFSHEAGILTLPGILIFSLTHREKNWRLALSIVVIGLTWCWVRLNFNPTNPLVAMALHQNSETTLDILGTVRRPLSLIAISTIAAAWVASTIEQNNKSSLALWAAFLCCLAACLQYAVKHDNPLDRYALRNLIIWMMPFVPALITYRLKLGRLASWIACVGIIAICLLHCRSIYYWSSYRAIISNAASAKPSVGFSPSRVEKANKFSWGWAQPYVVAANTRKDTRKALPYDGSQWYWPLTCDSFSLGKRYDRLFLPVELEFLKNETAKRHQCQFRP